MALLDSSRGGLTPKQWTRAHNPGYAYQMYYMAANIAVLNKLRRSKGLNEFVLRPHCGESGDINHLAATYLVGCPSVSHGIQVYTSLINNRRVPLCVSCYTENDNV